MSLTRIGSIGINTGIAFAGVTTIVTLNTANDALSIGATVNIGSGNLTVGSGVTVSSDGDVFFTGIATGNGSGLTALNASNISSGTVPTARLGSGTASSSTCLRGDSTFATVTSTTINNNADNRLITGSGTANTLEAESTLTYDGTNLDLGDAKKIRLGASQDLQIYHDTESYVKSATASVNLILESAHDAYIKHGGENMIKCVGDGAVELYYDNTKRLETTSTGVTITGGHTGTIIAGDFTLDNQSQAGRDVFFDQSADRFQFKDNLRASFGDDHDLMIYHDTNHSYIYDAGTGDLKIQTNGAKIQLGKDNGETSANFIPDGAVELYYDNVLKLTTESNGATVTGRFRVQDSGNVDLAITDTSTNAVAAYIGVKTAGYVEYNCYKSGVGTKYPHVFYGYTEEYARIDSAGIKFNGDTAAANALDDYEEGSFIAGCANGVTLHSSTDVCTYTKIGRVVTVRGQVRINSDNGTSDLVINNLPFTNYDSDGEDSSLSIGAVRLWDFNVVSDIVNPICLVVGQNTNLEFWYNRDNASAERLDADSNAYIAFTVTYFAT